MWVALAQPLPNLALRMLCTLKVIRPHLNPPWVFDFSHSASLCTLAVQLPLLTLLSRRCSRRAFRILAGGRPNLWTFNLAIAPYAPRFARNPITDILGQLLRPQNFDKKCENSYAKLRAIYQLKFLKKHKGWALRVGFTRSERCGQGKCVGQK